MIDVAFAIPGDIDLRTGGYIYDRRVMALLPQFGVRPRHLALPDGYPSPSAADLETTAEAFAKVPKEVVLMVDGLAYGAMTTDVIARATCPIVALVHHPLCVETGLSPERQSELKASETAALQLARRVIVTSATTAAGLIADFAVPAEKIAVAEPGTDPAPRAAAGAAGRAAAPHTIRLVAVGSVVPRKGYDVLVGALAQLSHLDWELIIAGDRDRSPDTTRGLEAQIGSCKLSGRVQLAGALDEGELGALYGNADLVVMPSIYEGYGMVLGEALARGLPIVATTGGAAAETVPDGTALKVPPGDIAALTAALQRAIADAGLRQRLADAAWAAGQKLPRWADTARIVAGAIRDAAP
jgi:glycosyltransferase involved in cell wall biosynthesis